MVPLHSQREASMKAILCSRFGGPDDLELKELPDPVAGAGDVVVAIRSAALSGRAFMVLSISQGLNQIGASQATSSETVMTAKTCEARIEPEVTPASSP